MWSVSFICFVYFCLQRLVKIRTLPWRVCAVPGMASCTLRKLLEWKLWSLVKYSVLLFVFWGFVLFFPSCFTKQNNEHIFLNPKDCDIALFFFLLWSVVGQIFRSFILFPVATPESFGNIFFQHSFPLNHLLQQSAPSLAGLKKEKNITLYTALPYLMTGFGEQDDDC